MKRRLVWIPVVVSLLAVTYVQSGDADALKKLEGRWKIQSAEKGGQPAPPQFAEVITFIFSGDKLTLQFKEGDKEDKKVSTIKVNTTKKPNHIDVTPDSGKEKGKKMPGIFELKGNTLKLAINEDGKNRPAEFASPANSEILVFTLTRAKGAKTDKK
jgi:uncharacterized protein (TIGR03067 family)